MKRFLKIVHVWQHLLIWFTAGFTIVQSIENDGKMFSHKMAGALRSSCEGVRAHSQVNLSQETHMVEENIFSTKFSELTIDFRLVLN